MVFGENRSVTGQSLFNILLSNSQYHHFRPSKQTELVANRIGAAKLIGSTYRIPSGEIWIRTTKSQLIQGKPRPNTSTRRIKGTNLSLGKLPQERDAIVVNTSEFTVEIQLQATSSAKPPGLPSLPRSPPKNASQDRLLRSCRTGFVQNHQSTLEIVLNC